MRVLGMISGTSHDGIDTAIVSFNRDGEELTISIDHTDSVPYTAELRERLIRALPPGASSMDETCWLDTQIGREFAAAAEKTVEDHAAAGGQPIDLVCTHGQTVYHWVDGQHAKGTLQLGQPAWIAELCGVPVVSDVRAADIAAGGQGAPLVPVLDELMLRKFSNSGERSAALNLGGIANVTVVDPSDQTRAWDIGPANALIDAVVTDATMSAQTFDRDGALASAGIVDNDLLSQLLSEPYYRLPAPKSSGKELFHLNYVRRHVERLGHPVSLADLVATLTELTAQTVADALRDADVRVVVASGGGVHNPILMARIRALLPSVDVVDSDAVGIPVDAKEAVAFALIGWASRHSLASNVPSCTGASGPRVLGRLSPGPNGYGPTVQALPSWPTRVSFTAGTAERA